MSISIALLTIHCIIPLSTSLKQKRSIIRPLLARLHKEFNLSAAEVDHLDNHSSAILSFVCLSNDPDHSRRVLQAAYQFMIENYKNVEIIEEQIEFL